VLGCPSFGEAWAYEADQRVLFSFKSTVVANGLKNTVTFFYARRRRKEMVVSKLKH
jgi:hypothetical protein